jgi:hypothetical protein
MREHPGACSDDLTFSFPEREPGSVTFTFTNHKPESVAFSGTDRRANTGPDAQTLAGAFPITEIKAKASNRASLADGLSNMVVSK